MGRCVVWMERVALAEKLDVQESTFLRLDESAVQECVVISCDLRLTFQRTFNFFGGCSSEDGSGSFRSSVSLPLPRTRSSPLPHISLPQWFVVCPVCA